MIQKGKFFLYSIATVLLLNAYVLVNAKNNIHESQTQKIQEQELIDQLNRLNDSFTAFKRDLKDVGSEISLHLQKTHCNCECLLNNEKHNSENNAEICFNNCEIEYLKGLVNHLQTKVSDLNQ
jgi:hypothetical protein